MPLAGAGAVAASFTGMRRAVCVVPNRNRQTSCRICIRTNFVDLLAAEHADELFGISLSIFELRSSDLPEQDWCKTCGDVSWLAVPGTNAW